MTCRGRDIATPAAGGAPVTLASAECVITASPRREILAIAAKPAHPHSRALVGARAGGASREALAKAMGDTAGAPIYQLIDDFAGASLVSGWIWMHWPSELVEQMRKAPKAMQRGPRVNVCTGFAEGSSALEALSGEPDAAMGRTEVSLLPNPDDPEGWHEVIGPSGPYTCRARRIDLWAEDDELKIDAAFQDSGAAPDGARLAIHEYRVFATVDPETLALRSLEVQPLILPFAECPGAAIKASKMIGQPIGEFRQRVIDTLPHTEGCTHLNDVLRALADVPNLAALLPA